jgi:hypothetical protein
MVAERFEFSDEAVGDAVGVLASEVVAATVVVELAGLELPEDLNDLSGLPLLAGGGALGPWRVGGGSARQLPSPDRAVGV